MFVFLFIFCVIQHMVGTSCVPSYLQNNTSPAIQQLFKGSKEISPISRGIKCSYFVFRNYRLPYKVFALFQHTAPSNTLSCNTFIFLFYYEYTLCLYAVIEQRSFMTFNQKYVGSNSECTLTFYHHI